MRISVYALIASAAAVDAHSIFQRVAVNGKDYGQLVALRAPSSDYPVQDVTSNNIACNVQGSTSQTVLDISPGDAIGSWWGHVLGGAQYANDPDNPIAKSHKGPIMAYLAKVDNAASASHLGLQWYKIAEDGFDVSSRTWGVDRMIANNGWANFTVPSCIAPGQYLLRVELLALHSAYSQGGAQFYMSCAQINVKGSGTFTPSQTVSLPGAYKATDPGILINIYGSTGAPDMGGKPYTAPGPAPITC